ncbi:MAG: carboxymuconolactone decarboxylase family protein [Bacteroidota bacterium]
MTPRLNIQNIEPEAFKAMYALEKYLATTQLTTTHKELIKIRTSQINGCAYCLDMHTKDALKYDETPQRIFVLPAWRETNLFTPEERAILALAEEVALISNGGVSDATYATAMEVLGETYVAQAIMATVTINAWNRIAISTQMQPAQ